MINYRKTKKYIGLVLALAGALLLISLFGHMRFNIEALQFRVAVQINEKGYTEVEVPPLGTIRAHTHKTPLLISLRLENIDLQLIQRLLAGAPEQKEVISQGKKVLKQVLIVFTIKLLMLALLGGALGVFLSRRGSLKKYVYGSLLGVLLTGMLLAATYYTYDVRAFRNPQYSGVLRVAPWMVSLAQETMGKIETLGEKLELVAANLNRLYERLDELQPLGETTTEFKILHISDLHNNPAGMDFAFRVAELFKVDMIIDTGDISDFGTPLETLLLDQLKQLQVPYLFIAGNHDSPAIIDKMNTIPGVTVVNGLVEKNGLFFYGVPDPSSAGNSVIPPDLSTIPRIAEQVKEKLSRLPRVDMLLLHNDKMARALTWRAPVILFGHNHQMKVTKKEGSIMVNAGTSGAAGLRGLQANKVPYTVVLLHLRPDKEGKQRLTAADLISVSNLEQGFILERKRFDQPEEPAESPDPEQQPPAETTWR